MNPERNNATGSEWCKGGPVQRNTNTGVRHIDGIRMTSVPTKGWSKWKSDNGRVVVRKREGEKAGRNSVQATPWQVLLNGKHIGTRQPTFQEAVRANAWVFNK